LRKKDTKIRRLCRGLSLFDDQKAAKSCKYFRTFGNESTKDKPLGIL
jgi:hypothetical protein